MLETMALGIKSNIIIITIIKTLLPMLLFLLVLLLLIMLAHVFKVMGQFNGVEGGCRGDGFA